MNGPNLILLLFFLADGLPDTCLNGCVCWVVAISAGRIASISSPSERVGFGVTTKKKLFQEVIGTSRKKFLLYFLGQNSKNMRKLSAAGRSCYKSTFSMIKC